MKQLIRWLSSYKNLILIISVLVWLLAWTLPWTRWLEAWPWIRLGISIFIFILPGFVLSISLVNEQLTLPAHITSGLAISTFIVGALGFLSRTIHLPFIFIKYTFMLFGLAGMFLMAKNSFPRKQFYYLKKNSITTLIILLLTMIVGFAIALRGGLELDDFSYM
ncbi:MAG: hypothetical protein R3307_01080, partial [Anaerolineales bacterium]|nr:hypothetical protein [Anaerolineales bacterium]